MCSVLVIERERSCSVVCECGYGSYMMRVPDRCPKCGGRWEHPQFEEAESPSLASSNLQPLYSEGFVY